MDHWIVLSFVNRSVIDFLLVDMYRTLYIVRVRENRLIHSIGLLKICSAMTCHLVCVHRRRVRSPRMSALFSLMRRSPLRRSRCLQPAVCPPKSASVTLSPAADAVVEEVARFTCQLTVMSYVLCIWTYFKEPWLFNTFRSTVRQKEEDQESEETCCMYSEIFHQFMT